MRMSAHASESELKKQIEDTGGRYNSLTRSPSFQYYLRRRKDYLEGLSRSIGEGKTILDLAAGTGSYSAILAKHGNVLNMDLSFNALKVNAMVNSANDRISIVNANALAIPLKDNSVDCVLLIGLLHHVPDRLGELFGEMVRVLKKGGTVIIDEANAYNLAWFVVMRLSEIDKGPTRPLFPHSLRALARRFRLTLKEEFYWGFLPPGLTAKGIDAFSRIESALERSFLSFLCTRYVLVLEK
jgi:ubiquinone/menaquinone biosynthesis C-methylase UbiE